MTGSGRRGIGGCRRCLFAWMHARGEGTLHRLYGERKRSLLSDLEGDVLEIGPGPGCNFPYFPPGIRWTGVEPNPWMHRWIRAGAARAGFEASIIDGEAERLPAAGRAFDAVVATLVLCSVADPASALGEILRVLRPGGRFVFIEHVAAPAGSRLRRRQHLVAPLWRALADGCHPDRETWVPLEAAGFARLPIERFEVRVPFGIVGPHISGVAVK